MDDNELDNLDDKPEEEQQEQETNIDDWRDQSIVIIDTSNPDAEIPNPRKDAGAIRRAYTEDKKSLRREMGVNINKGDGPSAKTVFEKLKVTVNRKGRVNGAEYDSTRIIVQKGKRLVYTEDVKKASKVNEFKELMKRAEQEHGKTAVAVVEEAVPDVRERRSCQLRFKKQHRKLGKFYRRKGCRNRVLQRDPG